MVYSHSMKFIITVDTEADNQWKAGEELTLKNISALPRFQALCEKYNFIPTYLITHEVADDPLAVTMLSTWQKNNKAEIGTHLHPWTNPPLVAYEQGKHLYPSSLTDEDFKNKLTVLTEKIGKNFGKRPTSYRAGRWGLGPSHAQILRDLGYVADCSVTPKVSWAGSDKLGGGIGPDFRGESVFPYIFSNGLLEMPMTILYTGVLWSEKNTLAKKFSFFPENLIKKILNKLFFQKKWLRIFPESTTSDWVEVYNSAKKNNLPVLEFMIHSSELAPGCSPYAKTPEAVEKIYNNLEALFSFLAKQGVEGIALNTFRL